MNIAIIYLLVITIATVALYLVIKRGLIAEFKKRDEEFERQWREIMRIK
jgi:hypothetical protein